MYNDNRITPKVSGGHNGTLGPLSADHITVHAKIWLVD